MSSSRPQWSKRSLTAQAMGHVDPITKAVVPPIHVATTYIRDEDNGYSSGFVYGRPDNATIREAEEVLAMLEEAEAGALLFSSGMAAATAVFRALDPGDHIVASRVMYWALRNWLAGEATRWGLVVEFVDTNNLDTLRAAGGRAPGGGAPSGGSARRIAVSHPAADARRRSRDARGHQNPQRPHRR